MSIYDEFMSMNWADVDDKPTIIDDSFNSVLRKHQDPVDFKKLAEDSQDGFNLLLKSKFSLSNNNEEGDAPAKSFSPTNFSKSPQTPKKSPKIGRKRSYSSAQSPSPSKHKSFINADKSTVAIRKLKVSRVSPGKSFASALLGIPDHEREHSRCALDFSNVENDEVERANDGVSAVAQEGEKPKKDIGPTSFAHSFASIAKKTAPRSADAPLIVMEPVTAATAVEPESMKEEQPEPVVESKQEFMESSNASVGESSDSNSDSGGENDNDGSNEKKSRKSLGPQVPLTEERIANRTRMIDIMKSSPEYIAYTTRVLPQERVPMIHPSTPDVRDNLSKRHWNGRCVDWKKRIHRWADQHPQYFTVEEPEKAADIQDATTPEGPDGLSLPKPPAVTRKLIYDYEAIIDLDRKKEQDENKRAKKSNARAATKGKKKQTKVNPVLVIKKSVVDDSPRMVNILGESS